MATVSGTVNQSQGLALWVPSFPEPSRQSDLEKGPKIPWDCRSFGKDFINSTFWRAFPRKHMCYLVHAPPVQLQERALMWTSWVRKPWGPFITFYSSHHPKGKSLGTCPAESGQTSDRATCLQSLVHMCAHTPHTNTWTWSSALHTEKKPSRNADMSTA